MAIERKEVGQERAIAALGTFAAIGQGLLGPKEKTLTSFIASMTGAEETATRDNRSMGDLRSQMKTEFARRDREKVLAEE